MKLLLLPDIARSLLLARWRQTLVAAVGVLFSITMFITLLGFMNGLNDMLDGLILNRTPHIRFYHEVKPNPEQPASQQLPQGHAFIHSIRPAGNGQQIHNAEAILQSLRQDPRVSGVSAKASTQVFYNVGNTDLAGVINGVDVAEEQRLFHLKDYVPEGNSQDLINIPNSILLGRAAARKMMASIGDVIQVSTPKGDRQSLKVVGYFESGLQDLDKVQSYTSLATAQKLLGETGSYLTDINVKLYDLNKAPAMAAEYRKVFDTDAEDIQTANAQFETGSKVRSIISYAVGITLLIVAGFGIYNILNMMIYEKMDSIAILKATGFSGQDIKQIFLTIALSIGIFGGAAGLLFGYLFSRIVDEIPFNTPALPTITTYPVDYNPKFYIIGMLFSLATTYLAGWFPARKAGRVDPVTIIRGK